MATTRRRPSEAPRRAARARAATLRSSRVQARRGRFPRAPRRREAAPPRRAPSLVRSACAPRRSPDQASRPSTTTARNLPPGTCPKGVHATRMCRRLPHTHFERDRGNGDSSGSSRPSGGSSVLWPWRNRKDKGVRTCRSPHTRRSRGVAPPRRSRVNRGDLQWSGLCRRPHSREVLPTQRRRGVHAPETPARIHSPTLLRQPRRSLRTSAMRRVPRLRPRLH